MGSAAGSSVARRLTVKIVGLLCVAGVAWDCSSSTSKSESDPCRPGETVACTTPEGCSGQRVCRADGSGFDDCACENSGGSGGTSSSNGGTSGANAGGSAMGGKGGSGVGGTAGQGASGESGASGEGGASGAGGCAQLSAGVLLRPMPNPVGLGLPNPQAYAVVTVDGDAVVRDTVTGLVWQQAAAGSFDWQGARDYCDALVFADCDEWRLPGRVELVSLVDFTASDPAIDSAAFPAAFPEQTWTSTAALPDPSSAWFVDFLNGYTGAIGQESSFRARCVVGDAIAASPRFVVGAGAEAGTVHDQVTGLTWQQDSTGTFIHSAAQTYCDDLNLGGFTNWRTPSMKELQTIVDDEATMPAIDAAVFPGTPNAAFWSSSSLAGTPASAWSVFFGAGNSGFDPVGSAFELRCVR